MPMGETDMRHVLEAWERKEDERDTEHEYFGEWVDKTAKYKAIWAVEKAKMEEEKLKKAIAKEKVKADKAAKELSDLNEDVKFRSTLDNPIGHSGCRVRVSY